MSLKLEQHLQAESDAAHGAVHNMPVSPRASFWAAGLAKIVTRRSTTATTPAATK